MASRVRWLPLIVSGAWNPALRVEAHGNSGVYALRRRDSGAVEYVGESHTGRLWKTLQRHFQKGQGAFGDVREWTRSSPAPYDAALWITSKGARAKKHGDQRALDMQARQIARLKPSDNIDDGKANDAERCPHGTTSRKCIEAHRLPPEATGGASSAPSSDPDTDFAFGANAPSSEDDDPWGGLLRENPGPRWETKLRFAKRTISRSGGTPVHTVDPTAPRRTLCGLSLDDDPQHWAPASDPRGAAGRVSEKTGHRWGVAGGAKACATCDAQRDNAERARELVDRQKGQRAGGRMQILLGSTRSPPFLRRMRALGWGRLFAAETPKPAKGEPWALDNGVFAAWKDGATWTDTAFLSALTRTERGISVGKLSRPLFCVLPDRVADPASLAFSLAWLEAKGRLFDVPWFLVVQNGMRPEDVRAELRAHREIAGVFLGGDDAFKLEAAAWCELAHGEGRRFHFARVSTVERLREAHAIGADSCDTTQPLWSEEAFDRFEAAALELGDAAPRARRPAGFGKVERSGQVRLCNPPARTPRIVVDVAPERRAENRTPDLWTGRTKLEDSSSRARRDWKGEAERAQRELAECRAAAVKAPPALRAPSVPPPPPPAPKPVARPEGYGAIDPRGQASMFRRNPAPAPLEGAELEEFVFWASRERDPKIVDMTDRTHDIRIDGRVSVHGLTDRAWAEWIVDAMRTASVDARVHKKASELIEAPPEYSPKDHRKVTGFASHPAGVGGSVWLRTADEDGTAFSEVLCYTDTERLAWLIAHLGELGRGVRADFARARAERDAVSVAAPTHKIRPGMRVKWTGSDGATYIGRVDALEKGDKLQIGPYVVTKKGSARGRSEPGPYVVAVRASDVVAIPDDPPKKKKLPTYEEARAAIFDLVESLGKQWTIKRDLKFPHVISPRVSPLGGGREVRLHLWFKPQAVSYGTAMSELGITMRESSSAWVDIREGSPRAVLRQLFAKAKLRLPPELYAENDPAYAAAAEKLATTLDRSGARYVARYRDETIRGESLRGLMGEADERWPNAHYPVTINTDRTSDGTLWGEGGGAIVAQRRMGRWDTSFDDPSMLPAKPLPPKKRPRAESALAVFKAIELTPAHWLATDAAPFEEDDPHVVALRESGAIKVLPPSGRYPRRYVVTSEGSRRAGTFDQDSPTFYQDSQAAGAKARALRGFRGKAAAQFKRAPAPATKAPAPSSAPSSRPEGYGTEERGKGRAKKGAGQLRLFNPGGLARGELVELGLLTFVAWLDASGRRRVRRWGLRSAPILAYDREGRLSVVYGDRPAGKATAEGAASYKRTHWGQRGQGERVAGSRLEGAAKPLGMAVEVIYTTRKGIDAEPVDYWHVFGEGARGAWKPPTLVHDPKLAGDPLAFRGGSYRVTERGIVG